MWMAQPGGDSDPSRAPSPKSITLGWASLTVAHPDAPSTKPSPLHKVSGNYCMRIFEAVYNNNQQVQRYLDILGPIAADPLKKDFVCCACGAGTGGCTEPTSHFCCSPLDPRVGISEKCYVQDWPMPSDNFDRYNRVFKDQCQEVYSWQFDDVSSTYQCIDGDYEIVFCP